MEMKQMYVQVVNLNTGKIFSLPTLYTDRTEACVCGQNYIRDRQAENKSELLFFRVLNVRPDGSVAPSYDLWDEDDNNEKPEHGESIFGGMLITELIDLLRSKAPEAPEEPNYLFEHWNG